MRKFLLLFVLMVLNFCFSIPVFALDIELSSGWNLVTVPVDSPQPVRDFLSGKLLSGGSPVENIDTAVRRIWSYDNNSWLSYADGAGTLTNFKSNAGYWFYMAQPAVLRIDNSSFSLQNLELKSTGWALVGLGNKEPLSFADEVFSSQFISSNHIAQNVPRIWGYRDGWSSFQTVPSMSSTTTVMNPGQGYWFYARNVGEHVINTNNPFIVSFSQQLTVPATPSGVSAVAADKRVIVSWTAVSGATEYRIFYKDSAGVGTGDSVLSVSGGSSSSGTVSGLINGTVYYFRVLARNMAGLSDLSNEVSAVPQDSGLPDPGRPQLKEVVGGSGMVSLSFGAVTGANRYKVYHKDSPDLADTDVSITFDSAAEGIITTAVTGLSYGKIWSFAVQAFDDNLAMGPLSNELRSAPLYAVRPANLSAGTHSYSLDYLCEGADVYFIFSNPSSREEDINTGGVSVSPQNNVLPDYGLRFSSSSIHNLPSALSLTERITIDNRRIAAELVASTTAEKEGKLRLSQGTVSHGIEPGVSTFNFMRSDVENFEPLTLRSYTPDITTAHGPRSLRIWVADNLWYIGGNKKNKVTPEMIEIFRDKFLQEGSDNDIYDWVTNVFGAEWGDHVYDNLLAPNGIIDIVLKDIEDDDNISGGTTFGYFWSENSLKESNNRMIAFVIDGLLFATKEEDSIEWSVNDYFPNEIISTIAHELQHMIHFYQHLDRDYKDTWLDELLSMATEDIVADKIFSDGSRGVKYDDYTAGSPGNNRGRLPDFNNWLSNSLVTWVREGERVYHEYATSYAFGSYLIRNYGVEVLKNIYAASGSGMDAVLTALSESRNSTSLSSGDVLSEWAAAVLFSDSLVPPLNMRYNSNQPFVSRINNIDYRLGGINLYNYVDEGKSGPQVDLTLTGSLVYPQMSNTYYLATTGVVGGNYSWQVEIPSGLAMMAVIKDAPVTNTPEIALVHIPSGGIYRESEGSTIINTREFYLGKYEITQGEWQTVMGSNPSHFSACGTTCPVENVSWNNIMGDGGFLDKLNNMNGCTSPGLLHETSGSVRYHPDNVPPGCFRLPTMDELEYAHRAGSWRNYHWGTAEDSATAGLYAWYGNNSPDNIPKPVGQKLPNSWGLHDMSGNVYEWTYSTDESGSLRVMRGGDWYGELTDQRSAHYFAASPSYSGNQSSGSWRSVGLRVLRVAQNPGDRALLPVPTMLQAVADRTGVVVSWSTVKGATQYRVYYGNAAGVDTAVDSVAASGGSTSSVTISGLNENVTYYFRVEARNDSGLVSRLSTEVSARTQQISKTVQGIEVLWIPSGTVNCTTKTCGNGGGSITINDDFYLGKYQVTQGQWEAVMGDNPSNFSSCGENCPVEFVSWNDINKKNGFLDELNKQIDGCDISGLDEDTATRYEPPKVPAGCFRLPTANEAEYAHRAGTGTLHYWGDDESTDAVGDYAWYVNNSNLRTRAVGGKTPNAWGLYDMSGNVFEWTYAIGSDQCGSGRLIRGGSWWNAADDLRSRIRYCVTEDDFANNWGFRLLLVNK